MADNQKVTLTLPSEPASVTTARRHVTDVLLSWGLSERAETVDMLRLIVSELATNAVQHTCGQSPSFTVELRLEGTERLRLGVTDSHPRRPRRLPAAVQQDNGRGLVIVRSLTAESGGRMAVTPARHGGKTVWVELPWQPLPTG
ncbi:ATP-binding protein [Streptomyces albus]|uniref:ATP-binding protein n=1 Tax=Streptomyces sp. PHES57 TaxID=2872626 RepID=UPI001CEC0FE9|nr:ATP-binding protein [Streptomyces sp. PHES57]